MLRCICGYGRVLCDVWIQHGVAYMCPRLPIDASAAYRENGPSLADKMDMENEHECEVSIDNDDTSSTRVETASTDADRTRMDRRSLNRYAKELDEMTINDLTANGVDPIDDLHKAFGAWYDRTEKVQPKFTLKFNLADGLNTALLPRDLLVVELREKNDLYDTYVGMYQHLARYNKDIIDRTASPNGKIAIQLDWYKKACDLLIKTNLDVMDTLTVDYSYTITNSLNNQRYTNKTKFLLFYYPVGLFESNNILPTHVINRMIVRYRFMDRPICFIPSVTNSYSNTNEFAVKVNAEFNKVLFEIIKFTQRDHDVITDQYDNTLDSFVTRTAVKDKPYKIDMTFKVTGTRIAIFNSSLLPNVAQYNSYYSESFSPFLVDMTLYRQLIEQLDADFGNKLTEYGFSDSLFRKCLESVYRPTNFNIAILWWFINYSTKYREKGNIFFSLRDSIARVLEPESEREKAYYKTKIKLVADNKVNIDANPDIVSINEDRIQRYYSFNEVIHIINALIMIKDDHFYYKYQKYADISFDNDRKKKPAARGDQGEQQQQHDDSKIKCIDNIDIKFTYEHHGEKRLYRTSLKYLYDHGYLTLDTMYSIERTINVKTCYDSDEIVNYLYYFNGLLENRYQNIGTLLYTASNLLGSYNNDMKSLYIIGESQCGKSVFKNILLQYINEYYEKMNTKPSDFNYDDSSILKVYDDVDLLEKSANHKTYLILNKDSLTVNINEKNKQPVRVYKDITNIVLNNDWPMITTWYHQRRVKTCWFIPISRKSLQYTVERIFKSATRGNGSFNDVFINNFFQYIVSFRDELYYDGVYYSDCKHLLDSNLSLDIISENIKNILNLDSISNTRGMVNVIENKCIAVLKQVPQNTYIDYFISKKFDISL